MQTGEINGRAKNLPGPLVYYVANNTYNFGNASIFAGSFNLVNSGSIITSESINVAIANQTSFQFNVAIPSGANYYMVTRNGLLQTPNVHYTWDPVTQNTIIFTSNTNLGDEIAVREFQSVNVLSNFSTTMLTYTANATQNQTTFTITANIANSNFCLVSKNGLVEIPGQDYNIVSNNQLIFTSNCNVNDRIEARLFPYVSMGGGGAGAVYNNGVLVIPGGSINFINSPSVFTTVTANGPNQANVSFQANSTVISTYQAVAVSNQSAFTLSSNCPGGSAYAIVGVNGVIQEPGVNYSISGNTNLQFTSNLVAGDVVEARIFGVWTGGTQGASRVLQQNVNLGLANASLTGGPVSTFFVIPGIANFGLVSQFTIQTNAAATYDIWVTSASGNLGNVMLGGSVYQSNTYNISTPWYYEADSTANGDTNMYITINNWTAGVNLNVNVAILRVTKFG